MARRGLLVAATTLLAALPALARADDPPLDRGIGQRVPNFTLKEAGGRELNLYRDYFGKKAVVLVFAGVDCPVANLYLPRLAELAAAYRPQGVEFVLIDANASETAEQVAEQARAAGLGFPALKDPRGLVADLTLAERTPEVIVLDGKATVRYRGAIDDQYGLGTRKPEPTRRHLAEALDALVAGRPVAVPATAVAGCPIERPKIVVNLPRGTVRSAAPAIVEALRQREPEAIDVGPITYTGAAAAIVQARCAGCHRPGEVGPFALLSYDDARGHAAAIREVVEERRMPPWHADPRYGHFANDRSLTARERATLLAWVDQGAPLGDPTRVPAPRSYPEGWTIGTPDLVFELPEPYHVARQGVLDYVRIRVPTHFKEDVWVQAAEARPTDRRIVHHIIGYIDDHTPRRRGDTHLCGYAPGDMPSVYPPGIAKRIPAGSDLIFEIHYTPDGKPHVDRSKIGLILAKGPPQHQAHTLGIANPKFEIRPGDSSSPVESSFTFPKDAHLLSFMPHMHLRGKDFRYTVTYPDGRTETLLSVPAYDFAWQSYYTLAESKLMPKGTRIDCLAHFDNSTANPNNPDPKATVRWGDQTFNEMMIGYIDYYDDAPAPVAAAKADAAARSREATRRLAAQSFRQLVRSVQARTEGASP